MLDASVYHFMENNPDGVNKDFFRVYRSFITGQYSKLYNWLPGREKNVSNFYYHIYYIKIIFDGIMSSF